MEKKKNSKSTKSVMIASVIMVVAILGVIIAGFFVSQPEEFIQGQTEMTDYRLSCKVPSRVKEIRVKEGDFVHKGDTLVIMEAPDIEAKLSQANAAKSAAEAMEDKAMAGARREEIQGAFEMWQKAKAGTEIAEKTYNRMQRLFDNGVMPEQKRDEAKANYEAMKATEQAAKAKYDMAQNGARAEEKAAASAQVRRAEGAVDEVSSYVNETILIANADGYVTEIFPEVGELVGTGAPIMNVATDEVWFTFNIREDKLAGMAVGQEAEVYMPSNGKTVPVKITRVKNVGNFAAWKATKALDGFDLKVFEVRATPKEKVEGVASGMSVILKQ